MASPIMRSCLLFQPHCDDAVLSAGRFIAGRSDVIVATVFGGVPASSELLTPYDEACGFRTSQEAMHVRHNEDLEALAVLKAHQVLLPFLDSQYSELAAVEQIAETIGDLITDYEPDFICGPIGVSHPDHLIVANAVILAGGKHNIQTWLWEDLPNSVLHPESLRERLDSLNAQLGFIGTGPEALKLNALWNYHSQICLPDFANQHCFLVPERFHKIVRAVTPAEQA